MKKNLFIGLFLFFFSFPFISFSQLSHSQFREYFTQANLMMLDNFYDTACKTFLLLHKEEPANANVNYKIGKCYLHLPGEKLKAIPYLENALKQTSGNYHDDEPTEKNAPEDAMYYLGQAYHYAYRFDDAIAQYQKYRDLIGKWNLNLVKEVDHHIEISKNAKEITNKPVDCTITNLGDSVNSQFPDYSPVISADESILAFTSRRLGTGGIDNKTINDEFMEDIWICSRGEFGTWTKAKGISKDINTNDNEATIGLSADGQQLYIYKANDENKTGDIYISKLDGEYWTPPYKLDDKNINSKYWEPSACISADGNTMYFVSDRPGGFGGRDIYQCHRLPNRAWSEPENLGPTINTPYNEDAPFIHPDGSTFFFSSDGHNSIGGFDIFYSTKVANTVWTEPINIGYPINTTDDDIYFVTSSDGRRAYYASFRPDGKGEKDIYMVSMPKPIVKSVAILVGYLKNRDGSPIPKYSSVTVKPTNGEAVTSKPNEASGKFLQSLIPGKEYEITITANDNKVFYDKFYLPEDSSYQRLGRGFFQRTIFIGDTTPLFSMHKAIDTTNRTKLVPMDGMIFLNENGSEPAKNITLQLLNSQGNIIATAITDNKGSFKFQNIPSDQKYIIKVDENDPIIKTHQQFYLADKDGKVIMPSTQQGLFFLFKNIAPEINKVKLLDTKDTTSVPLASMTGRLMAGKDGAKSVAKAKLELIDGKGKVLQSKATDQNGKFTFTNIPADGNFTISIKDNDPSLQSNSDLFLKNQKEDIIKKIAKNGDYFVFQNLPADLNKLAPLTVLDSTKIAAMKGRILKSANINEGIANLDIDLVDAKGNFIQKAKTDFSGFFKFENLSSDKNYTIRFNEKDPLFAGLKKIYLANEADKIIKMINLEKKPDSFRNLPADLMKMVPLKDVEIPTTKENLNVITKEVRFPGDEKYDFVTYFTYNKKDIDISVSSYYALIEKVEKLISEKGSATINILASSSKVPTKTFESNELLAKLRAEEVKDRVHASAGWKNLDLSKITFNVDSKVQGRNYQDDAVQKRSEYERWQYIKVVVQ